MIHVVDTLNRYANLLLACLTLIYVWLTYQMLKSLKHESLREFRIRHLQDIKSDVMEPLLAWFDDRVLPMLGGKLPFVSTIYVKTVRPGAKTGEPQSNFVLQLGRSSVDFPKMSHLFSHAKRTHFRSPLKAVDVFESELDTLWQEYLELATQCSQELSKVTSLPNRIGDAYPREYAENLCLIALCLPYLTRGEWPELRFEGARPFTSGELLVRAPSDSQVVAVGSRENVEKWVEASRQRIEKRWNISDLETKTKRLLAEAERVREAVSRIGLTYDLHGDCRYLGGQSAGLLAKLWQFFKDRGILGD